MYIAHAVLSLAQDTAVQHSLAYCDVASTIQLSFQLALLWARILDIVVLLEFEYFSANHLGVTVP